MIIRKEPKNWYNYEIQFEVELLNSYIQNIEKQVKISIDNFHKEKETIILEEYPEENYARIISVHDGLNDETWHLPTIFLEYFPNLQRKSAFVSLYGFLENELDKLCVLFKSTENFKIDLKDINGSGIERATKYLEKVAEVCTKKHLIEWAKIRRIQKIRNLIVHNGGKLVDIEGKIREQELKIINDEVLLDGEDEVFIKEGFLDYVLTTFDLYFKQIDDSIQDKIKKTGG